MRYGGNTSCVSVAIPGHDPILFDLGTGLRYFGAAWPSDRAFRGTCLLSHLHWDHIQGLPFFRPMLHPESHLHVIAPEQTGDESAIDVVMSSLRPPLFPIGLGDFPGTISFGETTDGSFVLGEVTVTSRLIPHLGPTCGYRLDWSGASAAYLSDHQQPGVGEFDASEQALELCRGVDVLIHDAQYTPEEFRERSDWGHCTAEYAVRLAIESDVHTLVLYHHDPSHDDDFIDGVLADATTLAADSGSDVRVIGAYEGLRLAVGA